MSGREKVAAIREAFPNPVKGGCFDFGTPEFENNYCVGGALAISLGHTTHRFPHFTYLARHLQEANPALSDTVAHECARAITDANDKGDFERAWQVLEEALTLNEALGGA